MISDKKLNKIINILKQGGVGIMPTDTLYGLVGSAHSTKAIKRIYEIKNRDKDKKLIVLISTIEDLKKFNIVIDKNTEKVLNRFWPGKTSIILGDIAFRLPKKESLIEILKKTGPLVAPSANPEGKKPAENVAEAKDYFGNKVDFYLAGGKSKGEPSTLIKIEPDGKFVVLRGILKHNGK